MASDDVPTLEHRLATLRDRLETGMDRREFVRTVASAGYVLGVAHLLGVEDFLSADDGEVPVVTALVRDDSDDPWSIRKRTRTVPAEWYAAVRKAFELNGLLARSRVTGYLGSAVVPSSYRRGGARLTVQLTPDTSVGDVRSAIEYHLDDIPLDVETLDAIEEMRGFEGVEELEDLEDDQTLPEPRFLDDVGDGVPGGVACETPDSMATLGPALYHPNGNRQFFVTAEHAFPSLGEAGGDVLKLPLDGSGSVPLGTVEFDYPREDVVAVRPTVGRLPRSAIDGPDRVPVRGQFTRFGLADLVARDLPLEKVGAMTGHTTGAIQGIDAVTCVTGASCHSGQIRWGDETDLTDGDSGSVSYRPDPDSTDGVLVAGFNNARTWWPGQSYIWGTAAYRVTELYGYHF